MVHKKVVLRGDTLKSVSQEKCLGSKEGKVMVCFFFSCSDYRHLTFGNMGSRNENVVLLVLIAPHHLI